MGVIDCSKCIHCEVCGDRYVSDGYAGECSYFSEHNPSGDLISREALKTELEVYRHTRNYKSDEDEAQNSLLDNVLEDIDNAQAVFDDKAYSQGYKQGVCDERNAREADRWIPVSERLPEPLISVIATDNNDVFVAWYNEGWKSSDSQFDKHTPIRAWRPIPRYTESEATE